MGRARSVGVEPDHRLALEPVIAFGIGGGYDYPVLHRWLEHPLATIREQVAAAVVMLEPRTPYQTVDPVAAASRVLYELERVA